MILRRPPPLEPSRNWCTSTETFSPGLISVRVHPDRTRLPGLVSSTTHNPSGIPGLATAFSIKMATCGLVQCSSFTVPSSTMNFSRSNIVVEWWADTG